MPEETAASNESIEMEVPVTRQTVHSTFLMPDPMEMEKGGVQLNYLLPDGHLLSFPISEHQKTQLGRKLLAPRVKVTDRIPPEAKKAIANGR